MTKMFSALIESVLWFAGLVVLVTKTEEKSKRIVKQGCKVPDVSLNDLQHLYEVRTMTTVKAIFLDPHHPFHLEFQVLPTGRDLAVLPMGSTSTYRLDYSLCNWFLKQIITTMVDSDSDVDLIFCLYMVNCILFINDNCLKSKSSHGVPIPLYL